MDNITAKKLIENKASNFKEKERCIKSIDRMWRREEVIDFFPKSESINEYEVEHITIIDGDFEINGLMEDAINDHSLLVVLGNLKLNRAIVMSEIFVTKDFVINDTAVFDSRGNYGLHVGGDIIANEFIESDHFINVSGTLKANKIFERGDDPRGIIINDCIIDEEYHKFREIAIRIREGKPIFL